MRKTNLFFVEYYRPRRRWGIIPKLKDKTAEKANSMQVQLRTKKPKKTTKRGSQRNELKPTAWQKEKPDLLKKLGWPDKTGPFDCFLSPTMPQTGWVEKVIDARKRVMTNARSVPRRGMSLVPSAVGVWHFYVWPRINVTHGPVVI